MRIYKTPSFSRDADKLGLTDAELCAAVQEIEDGLIDAHLGGELIKKRVASGTKGKRGGFRTVITWRQGQRCFFLHAFGKDEKANITDQETKALKAFGRGLMAMSETALDSAVTREKLREVRYVPNS